MATLIYAQIPTATGKSRSALWDLGFRPFYLLASTFAAVSILFWALQFGGLLPYAYLQGPLWHAHEMLFGFTLAVLTGFLLTAGAIGGMIIGRITRTALGHTGRKLIAGKAEVICYALVAAAAMVRVFVPLFNPSLTTYAVLVSASMWSTGFALYAFRYWSILCRN